MNNKGFTLIELLGVIIIITFLTLLVFPNITNSIKNSQNKINNTTEKLISSAVELYLYDSGYDLKNKFDFCIQLKTLVDDGYLKSPVKYNDNDITLTKSVLYNKQGDLKIVESNECPNLVCEAVNSVTLTTGKIPNGNYDIGDEYICSVDDSHKYHFFVLSNDKGKISLIMNSNIKNDGSLAMDSDSNIEWTSKSDYKNLNYNNRCDDCNTAYNDIGPITSMNYLYNITKNWKYVNNIEIDYDGNNNSSGYSKIITKDIYTNIVASDNETITANYVNLKARLPKYEEIYNVINKEKQAPLWLYNYTNNGVTGNEFAKDIDNILGYWLLSSEIDTKAYYLSSGGFISSDFVYSNYYGVRPVIEVYKFNIKN